jgi:hypothetical protein
MTDGAFYAGNLPFSKHQKAGRQNFVTGTQMRHKLQRRSFAIKFE